MYCFLNGGIIKEKDASVALSDISVIRGCAIFQVVRVYEGRPFLLESHFEKLKEDARKMDFYFPFEFSEVEKAVLQLIRSNGLLNSYLRLVLTGGETDDGFNPCGGENFFILNREMKPPSNELYEEGVKLVGLEHRRALPDIKITDYSFPIRERKRLKRAFDFLYTWNGKVLESTRANFFVIKKDCLITPEKNVLHGETRKRVLEITENSFRIEKRELLYDELKSVDEAFLSSTTREVLPVNQVDDIKIPVGRKHSEIRKKFLKRT